MQTDKIQNLTNATFVDVREPIELWTGKVAKAINIPLRLVDKKTDEFRSMSTPIIFFCKSGNRSGQAVDFLRSIGINEVYNGGSVRNVKTLLKANLK